MAIEEMQLACQAEAPRLDDCLSANCYLRRSKRPIMARAMPANLCQENGSLKKINPAIAIMAAPPARIMGTAESGPPFWNRRKKRIVPMPTQIPVATEYQMPWAVAC